MIPEEKQVLLAGKVITEGLTVVRWQNQTEIVPLAVGIVICMTVKSTYATWWFFSLHRFPHSMYKRQIAFFFPCTTPNNFQVLVLSI